MANTLQIRHMKIKFQLISINFHNDGFFLRDFLRHYFSENLVDQDTLGQTDKIEIAQD